MDRKRLLGLVLFLFIPIVLVLFTRPPFGISPGLGLLAGVALIALHRPLARPWVFRHARERSLWTGATLEGGDAVLRVRAGDGEIAFALASEAEAASARRFATFVCNHRALLLAGVFVPLLTLLVSGAAQAIAGGELFAHQRQWTLLVFQGVIALTVVATAILQNFTKAPAEPEPLAFPFPIHNLALVGIRNTLAVFVAVGLYWIGLSAHRLSELLAA